VHFQNFFTLYPLTSHSPFSLPQPETTASLLSLGIRLQLYPQRSGTSICALWLAFLLRIMSSKFTYQNFLPFQDGEKLHTWLIHSIQWRNTWVAFTFESVVNSADMSIGVQISCWVILVLKVEILDDMIIYLFIWFLVVLGIESRASCILARQGVYHLSHTLQTFCLHFWNRVSAGRPVEQNRGSRYEATQL
jgi:hypothetical protein